MLAAFLPEFEVVDTLLIGFISPTAAIDTDPEVGSGVVLGDGVGVGVGLGTGVGEAVGVGDGVAELLLTLTISAGRLLLASLEL